MTDSLNTTDQWVIAAPGVIVLPTTGYEIRLNPENGKFRAYRCGKPIGAAEEHTLTMVKLVVRDHMRDLLAVGIEP